MQDFGCTNWNHYHSHIVDIFSGDSHSNVQLYNSTIQFIFFLFKDFYNADPNCPGYVITAFEMLEMLKDQGSKGTQLCFIYYSLYPSAKKF